MRTLTQEVVSDEVTNVGVLSKKSAMELSIEDVIALSRSCYLQYKNKQCPSQNPASPRCSI